jgi:hypothetical protein
MVYLLAVRRKNCLDCHYQLVMDVVWVIRLAIVTVYSRAISARNESLLVSISDKLFIMRKGDVSQEYRSYQF